MTGFNAYATTDAIAAGAALSTGVNINNLEIAGLLMPAGWDAATISLQQAPDGAAWSEIYDINGNALSLTTAAGRYLVIPPSLLAGIGWLRIRSGTAAVPVNQTAARTLIWNVRNYGR